MHIYIKYHQKLSNNSFITSDPCRNPFLRMYSRFEKRLCKLIMSFQRLCVGAEVFSSQAKEQDQTLGLLRDIHPVPSHSISP